ncbi:transcriptional repressor LexA [Corynebacterium sp. TAE3-ERU12]|uniref:transcriptional repressor LexA n=1 Tax=Corynebacterium sp. TAE3-ERU12 TaxID=2849491 RepID=UPI001C444FFF|nr:transcriptional repressor LexA [Corynebacterium sp. TAE3-ERU12]MBV7295293.1 transcriptional repressor LexA [Corynebacterium sp. TAE3-ERU12]
MSDSKKPNISSLTDRQRRILDVIQDALKLRGYPPSIREIGDAVGLNSTSSVSYQLKELERKGFLRRDPHKPRAVDVRGLDQHSSHSKPKAGPKPKAAADLPQGATPAAYVPIVGTIAAGTPILAEQHIDDYMAMPEEIVGQGELYMLRIDGDSMKDAGIMDGDYVVVRSQQTANNHDFVAALFEDSATCKEYFEDSTGRWLLPHNDAYEPFRADEAQIIGKVVAVLRKV